MKHISPFAILCLLLPLLNSCASFTGFHTGRTLAKDTGEFSLSCNYTNTPDFSISEDYIIETQLFYHIEGGGRFGITDKLDAGIKANTATSFLLDAKFQLLGDKKSPFAVSAGLGLGSFGPFGPGVSAFNFQIPVYSSIHLSEGFALYLSPRYIGQFGTTFSDSVHYLNYIGFNTGLEAGRGNFRFGLDLGYFKITNDEVELEDPVFQQFGIGLKYIFE